jgi:hypothetical protein
MRISRKLLLHLKQFTMILKFYFINFAWGTASCGLTMRLIETF